MPSVSADIAVDDASRADAFPPVAYLIGAQKAGTTYLASLLDQAPDICLAAPKEPHFFTQHWRDGIDWYRTCFKDEALRQAQQSVWRRLPAPIQQGLKRRLTRPVPAMDDESRQLLEARFAPMVAPLEATTGLDLSGWRWRYQYVDGV